MRQILTIGVLVLLAAAETAADTFAFVDVTVVPMDTDRVLEHRTVVVRDDRIAAIVPAADFKPAHDVRIIEGSGRWLMPGLADMHVHTWDVDEFTLFLANGVTTVRNLWGTDVQRAWQQEIESGSLVGPTIYTAGVLIDGEPPIWPNGAVATTPEEGRALVREQHGAGYAFIKVYNRLKLEVYDAIVDEAAALGIPVVGHVPNDVGLRRVLEARQMTIEHLDGYVRACQPESVSESALWSLELFPTFDESKVAGVVAATIEAGTANCVTLVVTERTGGASEAEVDAWFERPEMRYVNPMTRAGWERARAFIRRGGQHDLALRGREIRKTLTRALHEAGAPILLGTDTPNPLVIPGFSIHAELLNLVESGMSPYEAIRCGTAGAAEHLDAAEEFGSVAVGRRADLILLEANPLDDVANVQRRVGVMVRGRWLPESEQQEKLDALAAKYEAMATAEDDPDADPFADVVPIDVAGTRLFQAVYRTKYGDMVVGHERCALYEREDGMQTVVAQAVFSGFASGSMSMRLEPGSSGRGERMSLAVDMGGRESFYEVTRDVTQLRVTGGPDGTMDKTFEIGQDAYLGSTFIGSDLAVSSVLMSLEPGESASLPSASLVLFPGFAVDQSPWSYTRQADARHEMPSGETIAVRTLAIRNDGMVKSEGTVLYDEQGHVVRYQLNQPMGTLVMERIE